MRYQRVHISAIGYELAPVVVTSEELEERLAPVYRALRVPLGQLEALTGIVERRYWEPGYSLVQGATAAARCALARSAVPASAIEALIYAGVCRVHFEPATACHVAAALERESHAIAPSASVYDLSNACLGVLNGMLELANRIELGQIRAGLVVSCESAREIVEVEAADRFVRRCVFQDIRFVEMHERVAVAFPLDMLHHGLFRHFRRFEGDQRPIAERHEQALLYAFDVQRMLIARHRPTGLHPDHRLGEEDHRLAKLQRN